MKRLLLFFFAFPAFLQAQLYIDFESECMGSWKQSRDSAWGISGTEVLYGRFSLKHILDDSIGGTDRISFPYDSLVIGGTVTSWQFALRHSWLPSSSNKWAVFLLSDLDEGQMIPGGEASGIVLGVNFSGSDDTLRLWRTGKGKSEIICGTTINWQDKIGTDAAWLRIEKIPAGVWRIFLGPGDSNFVCTACANDTPESPEHKSAWVLVGEGRDTLPLSPEYFGIYYRFSSRQDMKLWFDELCIRGTFIRDTIPPFIRSLELPDEYTLQVEFSENIDMQGALSPERYMLLPGMIRPGSVFPVSGSSVKLLFAVPFTSGKEQALHVEGIGDLKGNTSGILEKHFSWYHPLPGDIVFNEIMYDPDPEIGLPGYEYIELFNRSSYTLDLSGWVLEAGTKSHVLGNPGLPPGNAAPELANSGPDPGNAAPDQGRYELSPEEYLLLCYKGTGGLYGGADHALDVLGSRSMLLNDGAMVRLRDPDSVLVDWMEYSPGMHANEYYAGGGWSLERVDPGRVCYDEGNWTSSTDRTGGTPGRENSVMRNNPDRDPPEPVSVWVQDSHELVIGFNESLDREAALQKNSWRVEGEMGSPDNLFLQPPWDRQITLRYSVEFYPGKEYHLEIGPEIKDCAGNRLRQGREVRFALPVEPRQREVLISEVLFNPLPYCPDFIEVYNPGPRTFDVSDLRLANRDPQSGEIVSAGRIISGHRLFFPEEYLVFTEDPGELSSFFLVQDQACLVETLEMPVMGDMDGSVLILDKYLQVLDELAYDREMHHPVLASQEGVSLERISYVAGSGNRSNWYSASSVEGFGTPGRRNSQQYEADTHSEGIGVEPEIFTPNMDGRDDVLFIKYRFGSGGLRARILVFDQRGRLIREIASRQLLGTSGFFTWDGTDRQGKKARAGMYLVLAEVYGSGRKKQVYRKTCVLSTGR